MIFLHSDFVSYGGSQIQSTNSWFVDQYTKMTDFKKKNLCDSFVDVKCLC